MNVLSLLSAILATVMWIGGAYCFTRNRKTLLNVFSFIVLFLLGWWSFCYSFFFSAADAGEAMMWHRLASIGWTGFIAATTYYFIVLTESDKKMNKVWMHIVFYALPVILLAYNLFSGTTSLATGIVRSVIGGQWTLINSPDNIWLWLYVICLCGYFVFSFVLLFIWASRVNHFLKKRMAFGFIGLDMMTILLGAITDVVFPLTNQMFPSIANLCTSLFAAGYFLIIMRFDLFNVRNIVEDRTIIEQSMDSLMVTDEKDEILDVNSACCQMFDTGRDRLIGSTIYSYFENDCYKNNISVLLEKSDKASGVEMPMKTAANKEKWLLISASVIRDRKKEYVGTVLSMRDITQLNELKNMYHCQREQYRELAYIDALTGLPNRRRAFEHINLCTSDYAENQIDFFVIYMDIDNFKSVNDIHGHQIGDEFLKAVAERLKKCLSENLNFLSRLGGDEFLLVGQVCQEKNAEYYIPTIEDQFSKGFSCDGIIIQSGISAGHALYSDYKNVDDMIFAADEMMYRVKNCKRTRRI